MSRYANYTQSQYLIFIDSTDQEPKSANVGSFLVITDRTTGERIIKRWSGNSWDLDFEFNDPIDGTYIASDGAISYVQIRANEFGYMIPIEYIHELVHEKKSNLYHIHFWMFLMEKQGQ